MEKLKSFILLPLWAVIVMNECAEKATTGKHRNKILAPWAEELCPENVFNSVVGFGPRRWGYLALDLCWHQLQKACVLMIIMWWILLCVTMGIMERWWPYCIFEISCTTVCANCLYNKVVVRLEYCITYGVPVSPKWVISVNNAIVYVWPITYKVVNSFLWTQPNNAILLIVGAATFGCCCGCSSTSWTNFSVYLSTSPPLISRSIQIFVYYFL